MTSTIGLLNILGVVFLRPLSVFPFRAFIAGNKSFESCEIGFHPSLQLHLTPADGRGTMPVYRLG